MDTKFRVETWPEGVISLPPDAALMQQFKRQGNFNVKMPVPVMRAMVHLATRFMTHRLYKGTFRHRYQKMNGEGGEIGMRIVRPDTDEVLPAVLYFHGGGGMLTDSSSYLRVMKNIAYHAHAAVAGVDYRRAPEAPYPAGLSDAVAALQWMYDKAGKYGFDPKRISIAGDSAGGNLAAGLALRNLHGARLPIYRQILINARVTHRQHFPSISKYAEGYGLTRTAMDYFEGKYFRDPSDAAGSYASPLSAPDLRGLPPALVITSEYDPLRDEGEAYAAALHSAGVPVQAVRFAGMAHTMVVFGATKPAATYCLQLIKGCM
ncbi:alpha/beta hydrolase [Chitinophaga deserti]|uniref:alpha/beta hydrolase n=1 Tax=Chitinophaga deserti TaxID=2164099 RepID=UPI000D6D349C|nr:alpha/beta hydrolase [Chitinophaga deserti]